MTDYEKLEQVYHLPQHEAGAMHYLVCAWNEMCESQASPHHMREFQHHIHALQNMLMARGFARLHDNYADPDEV